MKKEYTYLLGLGFISGAIGCLSTAAFGCLAFGVGLLFASALMYLNSKF